LTSLARSLAVVIAKHFRANGLDAGIAWEGRGRGQKKEEARRASPDFLSGVTRISARYFSST